MYVCLHIIVSCNGSQIAPIIFEYITDRQHAGWRVAMSSEKGINEHIQGHCHPSPATTSFSPFSGNFRVGISHESFNCVYELDGPKSDVYVGVILGKQMVAGSFIEPCCLKLCRF
jgi:hypothetical protein